MLDGMTETPEKSVGWSEFVRFKHFVEEHAGVHEILARYS